MFKDIITLPEKKYLGFGKMIPWENSMQIQFKMWDEGFADGRISKLKKLCQSDKVLGIFCYRCDNDTHTFSYHIACENISNEVNDEFDELTLLPLTFARFTGICSDLNQRVSTYNSLCDEIWKHWLSENEYISLIELETNGGIEGYASVEIFNPENPSNVPYNFEIWLPIKNK